MRALLTECRQPDLAHDQWPGDWFPVVRQQVQDSLRRSVFRPIIDVLRAFEFAPDIFESLNHLWPSREFGLKPLRLREQQGLEFM